MKNSKQCPKCESIDIWTSSQYQTDQYRPGLTGRWILVNVSGMFGHRRKFVYKYDYVCLNCGYTESFIDEEGLKTIREYGFSEMEY